MSEKITMPELLFGIALKACYKPIGIRNAIKKTYSDAGISLDKTALDYSVNLMKMNIDKHIESYRYRGIQPFYQRSQEHPSTVIPNPNAGINKYTAEVQKILMGMQPREFEVLLGNLLSNECDEVAITPPKADGGFDFIGRKAQMSVDDRIMSRPFFTQGCNLFFFGEAKRYTLHDPIGTEYIRGLLGAIDVIKRRGGTEKEKAEYDALVEWGWDPSWPNYPIFATTGRYRSTIPRSADALKYTTLDGEQIAQMILSNQTHYNGIEEVKREIESLSKDIKPNVTLLNF